MVEVYSQAVRGFILIVVGFLLGLGLDAIARQMDRGTLLESGVVTDVAFSADGVIKSTNGGFQFPDGTIQNSASAAESIAVRSFTANLGLYDNRISSVTPPNAYTEVCFKDGNVSVDIHTLSESTDDGSCVPGDVGWMIERDERAADSWEEARGKCLLDGMRLPEAFEWKFSCNRNTLFGLSDMTNNTEWASNTAVGLIEADQPNVVVATVLGDGSCKSGGGGGIARTDSIEATWTFRCVL